MNATPCPLCRLLGEGEQAENLIAGGREVSFFESPMARWWPGAVMAVFHDHCTEQSDLSRDTRSRVFAHLLDFEGTLRNVSAAARINFVKFGNVVEHLHWHFVPRYAHETEGKKTPWELTNREPGQIYHPEVPEAVSPWFSSSDKERRLRIARAFAECRGGRQE